MLLYGKIHTIKYYVRTYQTKGLWPIGKLAVTLHNFVHYLYVAPVDY